MDFNRPKESGKFKLPHVSQISIQVLERIRQEMPTPQLLREVVNLLADWTGFEAVGIRLKEGDDYPYFQTRGMSEEFIRLENSLYPKDAEQTGKGSVALECVCGCVLQGRLGRSQPFVDEYGSFWTNSNTQLLRERPEFREAIRGSCVRSGYETSALIPIRLGGETFGLLQFEDRRPGMLHEELLSALESIAVTLALTLSQRRYAEGLQREKASLEERIHERSRELSEANQRLGQEIAGKRVRGEIIVFRDISETKVAREALQKARDELELRVEERTNELTQANLRLEQEISERKRIERYTRANNQVLRLMADSSSRQDFLDGTVKLVKEWTGCRCVGIRMLDSEGNIPYGAYTGFSRAFWEKENWLSISRDTCACTRVIAGKPMPQDACCMTASGSFVLNDSSKFLEGLTEKELAQFRGLCIKSGFRSIAIFPIRESGKVVAGIHIADERPGMFPDSQVGLLEALSRLIGEAIIKFNVSDALNRQKEITQNLVDRMPVMLCFFDGSGHLQFINRHFEHVFGWSLEDVQEDLMCKCFPDPQYREEARRYMQEARIEWRDFPSSTKSGEVIETSWSNVRMKDGSLIGIGIDLREKKRAQIAMERANRALRVLSESNYSLVQEQEERELLTHICRIITETGGYPLAWVGYVEENGSKSVSPVARWGPEADYIDSIKVSWADDTWGCGPVGRAIREGKFQISGDFRTDPHFSPWREAALKHGLLSNAAFPLIIHGKVIGTLIIYSSEADVFREHEEEVSLLNTLARNLAYGIGAIRIRKEHEQAEEELKTYMKKLEESNQALQDFASIASHDLQEPLRKVSAFGNMLQKKYGDSIGDEGRDYLRRMLNATERMQSLLRSLLDYSRVTSRAEPFRQVDLARLVDEVLSDLEVRIADSGGKVEVGELPVIEADPNQMRQLFQNLIGNGLKFHKEGEKPLVKVHCPLNDTGHCEINVEDNGIGFEDKHKDEIFAAFQRLHGRSSQYEGTGMGLAICKKIVERHGGSITARSTPGQGSIFTVRLPVKQKS